MINNIYRDPTYRYLIINCALVIIGYALSVQTHMASVPIMFVVKNAVLLLSAGHLLIRRISYTPIVFRIMPGISALCFLIVISSLLSMDALRSLLRSLTFIIPMMYVSVSIIYLLYAYEIKKVIDALIDGINWIYLLPILSFFLTGGSLSDTNIYFISVENEASAFVSNHYGWSATIFLVTGVDLIRNKSMTKWRKTLISLLCPIALYLVLISGNRTSWLCLLLVFALFLIRYKGYSIFSKIVLMLIPLLIVAYLLTDSKSAINTRIEKSKVQEKKGEARLKHAGSIVEYFNDNPTYYISGIGMFNSAKLNSMFGWSGYHNSYFEVLFGAGVPIFALFILIFFIRPGWNFIVYFSKHYLFLPPFIVIPYFESNLTGGQFLFFPWFITVVLMSYAKKVAEAKLKAANLMGLQKTKA